MNNKLDQFTNQYSLSKTLRFELKPVGETAKWIKKHNIIGNDGGTLVGKDAERATNYKYLKKLLDEMHRVFLEQALVIDSESAEQHEFEQIIRVIETNISNKTEPLSGDYPSVLLEKNLKVKDGVIKLTERLFNKVFNDWAYQYKEDMPNYWREDIAEIDKKIEDSTNNQQIKKLQNAKKKIENKIKKCELKASNHKGLYSNTESLQLLEWLSRKGCINVTAKEVGIDDSQCKLSITDLKSIIRNFDNFSTYLSGFNENRANVYDLKDFHSTSVLYRTFEQNLAFHFTNLEKWQKVTKFIVLHKEDLLTKDFDWDKELDELEGKLDVCFAEFFASVNFSQALNQSGINKYNQILGGLAAQTGEEKTKGLNEVINLARQKLGAKRHQLPNLQPLYKQILSKGDKPFIDTFKYDQELIAELNSFVSEQIDSEDGAINKVKAELNHFFNEAKNTQDIIYIPQDKLTVLSSELTGSWQAINQWRVGLFEQKVIDKQDKQKFYCITEIQSWLASEIEGQSFYQAEVQRAEKAGNDPLILSVADNDTLVLDTIAQKLKRLLTEICLTAEQYKQLSNGLNEIDKSRANENDKGFQQIATIKALLDACNNLNHFFSHFTVNRKDKLPEIKADFWYEKLQEYIDQFPIFDLYNKVRNHLTKKPFSTEKVKVNFENNTLLDGWDRNKEPDNRSVLFEKDGDFYLGIMTAEANDIFDYELVGNESAKKKELKERLQLKAIAENEDCYRKVNYKLLPGANKMLPKVFFANSNQVLFKPSAEITEIKNKKLYSKAEIAKHGTENLHKYIEFCQSSLVRHPEWSKAFGFSENTFKPAIEYTSIDGFYREVENLGYKLSYDELKTSYIEEKVANGELYLFQIYNKDFSKNKKGRGKDNLHTSYWKLLFSEENLKDVVLKLNGQAEIFYRPASIKYTDEKRQKGHHAEELKGKFSYPILKDRRYSVDKFLFHCPVTLNFKASGTPYLNQQVQTFLKGNKDINIIGIDRGEKHLLYISVINQQGEILHQESFNTITNSYQTADGEQRKVITDYHQKLDSSEDKRDKARKSWSTIENIKELKAGYLSHVVHRLAQLIIEHNAIVVLEDLNVGFKRGRFKIEKQVYQKFEKALIDKLNYLAFKDRDSRLEAGHYLNAYQLTNKFESFTKLGKQSGILFYVQAAYTSTTDPISGFIKNVYKRYSSIDDSILFWQSFDAINYIAERNSFEFSYDLNKLKVKASGKQDEKKEVKLAKTAWTVSSHVERSQYKVNKETGQGSHELFIVTDRIIKALTKAEINFNTNPDIKAALINSKSKELHETMLYCFNAILTMRVTDSSKPSGSDENDFILSPVAPYFDSRNQYKQLPENGDANGAYNIARKGIMLLDTINHFEPEGKNKSPDLLIRNNDWQNFAQQSDVVAEQKKKLS